MFGSGVLGIGPGSYAIIKIAAKRLLMEPMAMCYANRMAQGAKAQLLTYKHTELRDSPIFRAYT